MSTVAERRQKPRRKPFVTQQKITLWIEGGNGSAEASEATIVDLSEGGIGVEVRTRLSAGSIVHVTGQIDGVTRKDASEQIYRVCWCSTSMNGAGRYRAGLALEVEARPTVHPAEGEDYYELLQVSSNAEPETIQRVFRLLAQRYHPDNPATGNAGLFREVRAAYEVLINPEERAAYDAQLNQSRKTRLKIFQSWENSRGVDAEKRKRQGILALLYGKRMTEPAHPGVSLRELEDMLGCPREHLEFSLWFLKERSLVTRADNNKYAITWEGAEEIEREESKPPAPSSFPRLPAVSTTVRTSGKECVFA